MSGNRIAVHRMRRWSRVLIDIAIDARRADTFEGVWVDAVERGVGGEFERARLWGALGFT